MSYSTFRFKQGDILDNISSSTAASIDPQYNDILRILDIDLTKIPDPVFAQRINQLIVNTRAQMIQLKGQCDLGELAKRIARDVKILKIGYSQEYRRVAMAELQGYDSLLQNSDLQNRNLAEKLFNPMGITRSKEALGSELTRLSFQFVSAPLEMVGAVVSHTVDAVCSTPLQPVCTAITEGVKAKIPEVVSTAAVASITFASNSVAAVLEKEGAKPDDAKRCSNDAVRVATWVGAGKALKVLTGGRVLGSAKDAIPQLTTTGLALNSNPLPTIFNRLPVTVEGVAIRLKPHKGLLPAAAIAGGIENLASPPPPPPTNPTPPPHLRSIREGAEAHGVRDIAEGLTKFVSNNTPANGLTFAEMNATRINGLYQTTINRGRIFERGFNQDLMGYAGMLERGMNEVVRTGGSTLELERITAGHVSTMLEDNFAHFVGATVRESQTVLAPGVMGRRVIFLFHRDSSFVRGITNTSAENVLRIKDPLKGLPRTIKEGWQPPTLGEISGQTNTSIVKKMVHAYKSDANSHVDLGYKLHQKVEKMVQARLPNGDILETVINPKNFKEFVTANMQRAKSLGWGKFEVNVIGPERLSHKVHNLRQVEVPGLELKFKQNMNHKNKLAINNRLCWNTHTYSLQNSQLHPNGELDLPLRLGQIANLARKGENRALAEEIRLKNPNFNGPISNVGRTRINIPGRGTQTIGTWVNLTYETALAAFNEGVYQARMMGATEFSFNFAFVPMAESKVVNSFLTLSAITNSIRTTENTLLSPRHKAVNIHGVIPVRGKPDFLLDLEFPALRHIASVKPKQLAVKVDTRQEGAVQNALKGVPTRAIEKETPALMSLNVAPPNLATLAKSRDVDMSQKAKLVYLAAKDKKHILGTKTVNNLVSAVNFSYKTYEYRTIKGGMNLDERNIEPWIRRQIQQVVQRGYEGPNTLTLHGVAEPKTLAAMERVVKDKFGANLDRKEMTELAPGMPAQKFDIKISVENNAK